MIYEYRCAHCSHEWEVEQRLADPVVKQCPKCLWDTAKRLISKTSFRLKGQGWSTDGFTKLP